MDQKREGGNFIEKGKLRRRRGGGGRQQANI